MIEIQTVVGATYYSTNLKVTIKNRYRKVI
nr:MAG TPA: hypothetical protein [Caudoviricetes sp.]